LGFGHSHRPDRNGSGDRNDLPLCRDGRRRSVHIADCMEIFKKAFVAAGDRICLVGRNGSGKSTLLRIAAGLVQADTGERFAQPGTISPEVVLPGEARDSLVH
jgi:hypothetical protein